MVVQGGDLLEVSDWHANSSLTQLDCSLLLLANVVGNHSLLILLFLHRISFDVVEGSGTAQSGSGCWGLLKLIFAQVFPHFDWYDLVGFLVVA